MAGETQPTLPLPPEPETPRRRRGRGLLVGLTVTVVLLVVAALAGEWLARDMVEKSIRQQAVQALGVSPDSRIDVDIPGSLLFQLVTGTIGEATVSSPDLEAGGIGGAVAVTIQDLALRDGPSSAGGSATVELTADQLRALMATVDGFPADTLGLAAPDVTASVELGAFGFTTQVGLALTPGADAGDLVLSPSSLSVGDAQLTAAQLRERFGRLAAPVVQDWRVCIAEHLPAALTLTGVDVEGEHLVARFDIAPGPLTEDALAAHGTCG